jgi:hypothetical protein
MLLLAHFDAKFASISRNKLILFRWIEKRFVFLKIKPLTSVNIDTTGGAATSGPIFACKRYQPP